MSLVRNPALAGLSMTLVLLLFPTSRAHAESARVSTLDLPASVVDFTITASKMTFKTQREGRFKDFTGRVAYDPARPADTRVDLTVLTASVDMQNAEHDELLKSAAFFDVDRYPTMQFSSASTVVEPDGTLSMTGDMTIRGITKRMTIPVTLRQDARLADTSAAVLDTTFQIDRTEFGLNGVVNLKGFKASISKKVQIHIAIATTVSEPQLGQ